MEHDVCNHVVVDMEMEMCIVFHQEKIDERMKIQHLYRYLNQCLIAFNVQQTSLLSSRGRILKLISWKPPNDNWWKLNTDGSSRGNPGLAGDEG